MSKDCKEMMDLLRLLYKPDEDSLERFERMLEAEDALRRDGEGESDASTY